MFPGEAAIFKVCAVNGAEKPGADNILSLRAQIHRECSIEQRQVPFALLAPVCHYLRSQGAGCPGVHNILFSGEAARLVALAFGVSVRHI